MNKPFIWSIKGANHPWRQNHYYWFLLLVAVDLMDGPVLQAHLQCCAWQQRWCSDEVEPFEYDTTQCLAINAILCSWLRCQMILSFFMGGWLFGTDVVSDFMSTSTEIQVLQCRQISMQLLHITETKSSAIESISCLSGSVFLKQNSSIWPTNSMIH